jgi:transcriptional regulator with XRE-family HTH domain
MSNRGVSALEFLGAELRRARKARAMSQEELAEKINYSASLVGMVEIGHRTPSVDFLDRADAVLETDGLLGRLLTLVKSEAAPPWFMEWIKVEQEATSLRWFEPSLVPGLLQTEAYARAVLRGGGRMSEPEVEQHLTSRMERQSILDKDNPTELVAVIDEAVLHRAVDEPAVMAEQFDHLLRMCERPNVRLHVVPAEVGMYPGLAGPFILARVREGGEVVHLDNALFAHITDRHVDVDKVQQDWESVRSEAMPSRASLSLIREVAKSWT